MAIKEYYSPSSLVEAAQFAADSHWPVKYIAGGTDLMVHEQKKGARDISCVSLKNVHDLNGITETSDGKIFIGAMISHAELAGHSLISRNFHALAEAAELVGGPSTRSMGTVGGNICNASPAADTAPPLIAYDAQAVIWCEGSEVTVPVKDFFVGPSKTILKKGEILKGFLLEYSKGLKARYAKLGQREAMEIGIVNICVVMRTDDKSYCDLIRIALGSVAPKPIRARGAEAVLGEQKITSSLIRKAAETAEKEVSPISDVRGSATYRRDMVGVLVERTINMCRI